MVYYIIRSLPPSSRKNIEGEEENEKRILQLFDISGGKDVGEEIWGLLIFFSS